MGILADIKSVQPISSTSTQGVIPTANTNFRLLANALFKFLTQIGYSEEDVSVGVRKLISQYVEVNGSVSVKNDSGERIRLDSSGSILAQGKIQSRSEVEAPMITIDYCAGLPGSASGGQIVYARNADGDFDFFGYVNPTPNNEGGWVSLTDGGGSGPGPGYQVEDLEAWSTSVESFITELPSEHPNGARYIVSEEATGALAGHAGEVAFYNELKGEWEFASAEQGAFVVVKEEGNIIYVADNTSGKTEWVRASISEQIGGEQSSGGLNDFLPTDTISYVISVLDKEMYDIFHEALHSFMHNQGKAYVGADGSEDFIPSTVRTDAGNIYADDVESNCSQMTVPLEMVNDVTYRIPETDVRALISPAYGSQYEAKIIYGGSESQDLGQYIIEYQSGTVFFKEISAGIDPSQLELKAYFYTGEYLSDKMGTSMAENPNKNMHVSRNTTDSNFVDTGLATSKDYRGYIDVKINGVSATVCTSGLASDRDKYDCYFSADGITPVSYLEELVPEGTKLYWNSTKAGFILETDDVVSLYYL